MEREMDERHGLNLVDLTTEEKQALQSRHYSDKFVIRAGDWKRSSTPPASRGRARVPCARASESSSRPPKAKRARKPPTCARSRRRSAEAHDCGESALWGVSYGR